MKITAESTEKIVTLESDVPVQARIWEAVTAGGVKCHLYVTRVAVEDTQDQAQFERELHQHKTPSMAIKIIPLRLVI